MARSLPTGSRCYQSVIGVKEVRLQDEAGAFRVIYLAKLEDAVYVLHCFQKKTQQTSEKDIKLARKRFKDLMRKQP